MRYLLFVLTLSCFMVNAAASRAAQLTIAFQGKSTYSIVLPQSPPSSIQAAAQELQKDVDISTGAKLLIVADNAAKSGHFISLGATKQAQRAGISAKGIAPEGFRIVTRAGKMSMANGYPFQTMLLFLKHRKAMPMNGDNFQDL